MAMVVMMMLLHQHIVNHFFFLLWDVTTETKKRPLGFKDSEIGPAQRARRGHSTKSTQLLGPQQRSGRTGKP